MVPREREIVISLCGNDEQQIYPQCIWETGGHAWRQTTNFCMGWWIPSAKYCPIGWAKHLTCYQGSDMVAATCPPPSDSDVKEALKAMCSSAPGLDRLAADDILWKSIPSITAPPTFCKSRVMQVLKTNKVQKLSDHRPRMTSSVIILGRWWTEVTELLEQFTFQIDRQQLRSLVCSSSPFQLMHPWPLCCYGGHIEVVWCSQLRFHFWDCGELWGPASELDTFQLRCNDLLTTAKGTDCQGEPLSHLLFNTVRPALLVRHDKALFARLWWQCHTLYRNTRGGCRSAWAEWWKRSGSEGEY